MNSFLYTPDAGMTPESVKSSRDLGAVLMRQGMQTNDVQHWTQALGKVLQSGSGAMWRDQANEGERQGRASANQLLAQALQGGDLKSSIGQGLANPWAAETFTPLAGGMLKERAHTESPMGQLELQAKRAAIAASNANAASSAQSLAHAKAMSPLQLRMLEAQTLAAEAKPQGELKEINGKLVVVAPDRSGAREIYSGGQDAKIPQGYRSTPDGNLQAIPGGPADVKMSEKRQQDYASMTAMFQSMDALATQANELLNHKGLDGIYGLRGAIPNMPGSNAADAQAKLMTLLAKSAFTTLQDIRNSSKTGGALGAVSDKEMALLQANIAALEKSQSAQQARESFRKIMSYTEQAKKRLSDAYNDHWNNDRAAARSVLTPTPPVTAAPPSTTGAATERKSVNGKSYLKIDGQWYEE